MGDFPESCFTRATLPVECSDLYKLDSKEARSLGEMLSHEFHAAEPFSHIVIDNFLPNSFIEEILRIFPSKTLSDDKYYEDGYSGLHKRQVSPESCNHHVRSVFHFFNSAPFLQFLQGLTSIDSLIGDPYFNGGGFHEIFKGGKLGVHADFRINEQLHLARRLNVLIYLNKDWHSEYGGDLEIWSRDMKYQCKSISPEFNRCVIFCTDTDSYHGHPEPLNTPHGVTRKSLALYYYTASKRIYEDLPSDSTMYVARPADGAYIKREAAMLRMQNYLKDWLPPAVFRSVVSVRRYLKNR